MADIVKSKNTLQLTQLFIDGTEKLFTVDNAKASISAAQIEDLSGFLRDNSIILNADGSPISAISFAKTVDSTETILDIE